MARVGQQIRGSAQLLQQLLDAPNQRAAIDHFRKNVHPQLPLQYLYGNEKILQLLISFWLKHCK